MFNNNKNKYQITNLPKDISSKECFDEAINVSLKSVTLVEDKKGLVTKKDLKTLILFPKIKLSSLVDNENDGYKTLGSFMKTDEVIYDEELENIDYIVEKTKEYDKNKIIDVDNYKKFKSYKYTFTKEDNNENFIFKQVEIFNKE